MTLPTDIKDREFQRFIEPGLGNVAEKIFYPPLALKLTTSGAFTYIAKAPVGTAQASASWQVFRIDETVGMVITWADGNDKFDNVATDLTALAYS